jgi:hypothetical protein
MMTKPFHEKRTTTFVCFTKLYQLVRGSSVH